MRLASVLLIACMLLMTACAKKPRTPCHDDDIQKTAKGVMITESCWQNVLGDLDAFDKAAH